jgi:hypothetical protein
LEIAEEIKNWKGKPKELVTFLTEKIAADHALFPQVIKLLKTGSKIEKGTSADIIEKVSIENPELVAPYLNDLIDYINFDLPRVKWGIPQAIGNLSKKYPIESGKAIPKLLINTKDESTVVKWCAAFAISEIAKYNTSAQSMLLLKMQQIAESEKNNGVKNVYLKAIKKITPKIA